MYFFSNMQNKLNNFKQAINVIYDQNTHDWRKAIYLSGKTNFKDSCKNPILIFTFKINDRHGSNNKAVVQQTLEMSLNIQEISD